MSKCDGSASRSFQYDNATGFGVGFREAFRLSLFAVTSISEYHKYAVEPRWFTKTLYYGELVVFHQRTTCNSRELNDVKSNPLSRFAQLRQLDPNEIR